MKSILPQDSLKIKSLAVFLMTFSDATDSICPKGWEMARYNGDGSYYNLFRYEYMGQGPLPSGNKTNADAMVNMLPFSFIENGRYGAGEPTTRRGIYGSYKIGRVHSRNLNNVFTYYESESKIYFSVQSSITKSRGDSVRCGDKFENVIKLQ